MSWQDSCRSLCKTDFSPLKDSAGGAAKCTGWGIPAHSQCAAQVIYYSQYCLGFANNPWSSELAAPVCHSLSRSWRREQSGHWLTVWVFFPKLPFLGYLPIRIPLVGVSGSSGAFFTGILKSCFLLCQRRAAMLCSQTPAQKKITAHLLTPARASPAPALLWWKMGKGTFPTAASIAREMWVEFRGFISKCLGTLKNFMSKLLCRTENSG